MDPRTKALNALRRTFKKRTISIEAREGDRYWVSNGAWLANVHRGELHILLPTLPINALGVLADLEPGRACAFTEEGAQFDFGGVFPLLEEAHNQTQKVVTLPFIVTEGPHFARLLVVDDRLIFVNPDFWDGVHQLVGPDDVTAVDERSLIAFWKDGEVLGALMPTDGPEVETREGANRLISTRWRPDGKGAESVKDALDRFLEAGRNIVGDEGTMTMNFGGEEHTLLEPKQ